MKNAETDHRIQAEMNLEVAAARANMGDHKGAMRMLARAQVHATLASAGPAVTNVTPVNLIGEPLIDVLQTAVRQAQAAEQKASDRACIAEQGVLYLRKAIRRLQGLS